MAAIVMPNILKMLLSRRDSKPRRREGQSGNAVGNGRIPAIAGPQKPVVSLNALLLPTIVQNKAGMVFLSLDLCCMRMRYYDVDFYNLKVIVFHFMIPVKNSRIPIDIKTYKLKRWLSSVDLYLPSRKGRFG